MEVGPYITSIASKPYAHYAYNLSAKSLHVISYITFASKPKAHNVITTILAWEFVTQSCLKPQNPCSNHEIHVLFEHGFYLKKPKLGPDLHT